MTQATVDARNESFWHELCGSDLARRVGLNDASDASLARFDRAYFDYYPYLKGYVDREQVAGRRILEIGLGYGSLSQYLASKTPQYHGLDIAGGPVSMVRHRLRNRPDIARRVTLGSAFHSPYDDGSFDFVFSVGCLHHTGDLARAVDEVHRVLTTGGRAVVMVYNRLSFSNLVIAPGRFLLDRVMRRGRFASYGHSVNRDYDLNGRPAPHTEFLSFREAHALFARFSQVRIQCQNFFGLPVPGTRIAIPPRRLVLNNLARLLGADLYITATKTAASRTLTRDMPLTA